MCWLDNKYLGTGRAVGAAHAPDTELEPFNKSSEVHKNLEMTRTP